MKTLYINTATKETTIAIFDGDAVMDEKRWTAENNESEKLLPAVQQLLEEYSLGPEDIGQLVVCVGPGGFTSVRVGVSAANAWAKGMEVPVAAVSIFDLYPDDKTIIVSANKKETWITAPGKAPGFVHIDSFEATELGNFCGILNDDWKRLLEEHGGQYEEVPEGLPRLKNLEFGHDIVQPWYYKAPNITWSAKIKRQGA